MTGPTRTLEQALRYAELAPDYLKKRNELRFPKDYLHMDIVLLAAEVKRLRELLKEKQ